LKKLAGIGANAAGFPEFTNYLEPVIKKASGAISKFLNVCVGDYTGAQLASVPDSVCNAIPYDSSVTMGTIVLKVSQLPCPAATDIKVCFTFSKCGSFGLVFNGGILACAITATGVGAVLAPLAQAIDFIGFVFSMNNKILHSFDIWVVDTTKNDFVKKGVTAKANFYVTLGISLAAVIFPDSAKIGGKKISEIISITGKMTAWIDFGKLASTLKTTIDNIRKGSKDTGKQLIEGILRSGAEIGLSVSAQISLNLADLTKGFLPDAPLAQADINVLATLGGGSTGIGRGLYISFIGKVQILTSFYNIFKDKFDSVFGAIGIKLPAINLDINADVAIAVQDDVFGIKLTILNGLLNIICMVRYKGPSFSCKGLDIGAIFSLIAEGVKWVARKVAEFFSNVGKTIVEFAKQVGEFFVSTGKAIADAFVAFGNKVAEVATQAWNGVKTFATDAWNGVKQAASTAWNAVSSFFSKWKRKRFLMRLKRMRRVKRLVRLKKMLKRRKRLLLKRRRNH